MEGGWPINGHAMTSSRLHSMTSKLSVLMRKHEQAEIYYGDTVGGSITFKPEILYFVTPFLFSNQYVLWL